MRLISSATALPLARGLLAAQALFGLVFPLINFAFIFLPMGLGVALLGPVYLAAFVPPFSIITGPLGIVAAWRMKPGSWWAFALGIAFELAWMLSPIQQLSMSRVIPYERGPGSVFSLAIGLTGIVLIVIAAIGLRPSAASRFGTATIPLRSLFFGGAAATLLLAAVTLFGLLLAFQNRTVSYDELLSHPEARLYYPGSQVISATGTGEEQGLDVHTWATFNSELRSSAMPSDILSWYEQELNARGWVLRKSDAYGVPSRVFTLEKREEFQVSVGPDGTYGTRFTVLPVGCGDSDTTFHNCTGF